MSACVHVCVHHTLLMCSPSQRGETLGLPLDLVRRLTNPGSWSLQVQDYEKIWVCVKATLLPCEWGYAFVMQAGILGSRWLFDRARWQGPTELRWEVPPCYMEASSSGRSRDCSFPRDTQGVSALSSSVHRQRLLLHKCIFTQETRC